MPVMAGPKKCKDPLAASLQDGTLESKGREERMMATHRKVKHEVMIAEIHTEFEFESCCYCLLPVGI